MLLANCYKYSMKPSILCQLLDAFVGSILNYGSEIWGFGISTEIERIHLKCCKTILNVRINTSNCAVYGELGRYPLFLSRYIKIIKYWYKVADSDNVIVKEIYDMSVNDCENGKRNWVADVKDLLSKHGYAYVFNNPSLYDVNTFVSLFKHTLIDIFKQTWCNDKAKSGVLKLYDNIKNTLDYEQ